MRIRYRNGMDEDQENIFEFATDTRHPLAFVFKCIILWEMIAKAISLNKPKE